MRWPDLHMPHFQFGRIVMAAFCFLLPVLIVFGDIPWFIHGIFLLGTVSKLQLTRYLVMPNWHFLRFQRFQFPYSRHGHANQILPLIRRFFSLSAGSRSTPALRTRKPMGTWPFN